VREGQVGRVDHALDLERGELELASDQRDLRGGQVFDLVRRAIDRRENVGDAQAQRGVAGEPAITVRGRLADRQVHRRVWRRVAQGARRELGHPIHGAHAQLATQGVARAELGLVEGQREATCVCLQQRGAGDHVLLHPSSGGQPAPHHLDRHRRKRLPRRVRHHAVDAGPRRRARPERLRSVHLDHARLRAPACERPAHGTPCLGEHGGPRGDPEAQRADAAAETSRDGGLVEAQHEASTLRGRRGADWTFDGAPAVMGLDDGAGEPELGVAIDDAARKDVDPHGG
jgi:hypothetical protein